MIELIATVESLHQAKQLLDAGVDILYFGAEQFGLRLPTSFTREEQAKIVQLAHQYGKKVSVAVNAIFHNDGIKQVPEYLLFLKEIGADSITVGDPGVVQIMKDKRYALPYRYDAQVIVTSSRQINFWAKRGAVGAVLAREIPREELKILASKVQIPVEILVYGATCIHHSKRPLLQNYFSYIQKDETHNKERGLFISEPKKDETHYSIFEDQNGTHVFATDDLLLIDYLDEIASMPITQWKLEGLFIPEDNFVKIATLFNEAREAISSKKWNDELRERIAQQIKKLHPENRTLDPGFYLLQPGDVK